jgi:hypothetical protein
MLGDDHILLKCSLPMEFNDPFELFLTVDFNIAPRVLAFYQDLVGDVVQTPTACFSRAPDVVPMWAHYGSEGEGAVIELDEECLLSAFPECRFGDVEYREAPDPSLTGLLEFAAQTLKFRHSRELYRSVVRAAYFTKAAAWAYELERRMVVVEPTPLMSRGRVRLLRVPQACVTGVFAGHRAQEATRVALGEAARRFGSAYYEMFLGRLAARPFFEGPDGAYQVVDGVFSRADYPCSACGEPMPADGDRCSWCSVSEELRAEAAMDNPLRLLDRLGMLEDYMEGLPPRASVIGVDAP